MARIKQVFSSNSQVAHVWAQQTQQAGRSGSVFFEANRIYSYGHHYLMGQIVTAKGKRVALINSHPYSNTTARHISDTVSAVSGLMPYLRVPNVSKLKSKENTEYFRGLIASEIKHAQKRLTVKSKSAIEYQLERIQDTVKEANEYFALVGMPKSTVPAKVIKGITAHLEARLKRYAELNTPEEIAKREAKAEARAVNKAAKSIQDFREGKPVRLSLPHDLLRVQGDTVVTSRGAEVPLKAAKRALRMVQSNESIRGLGIGSFTAESVLPRGDDKVVKIGCHKVLLSEAVAVLGNS